MSNILLLEKCHKHNALTSKKCKHRSIKRETSHTVHTATHNKAQLTSATENALDKKYKKLPQKLIQKEPQLANGKHNNIIYRTVRTYTVIQTSHIHANNRSY